MFVFHVHLSHFGHIVGKCRLYILGAEGRGRMGGHMPPSTPKNFLYFRKKKISHE
jgi:hypothetical protein